MNKYYDLLFWKFLTSNITHNFQRLIEDRASYEIGVEHCLKKCEKDRITRTMFANWTQYFELSTFDSNKLILKRVAKKIITSTIFELNSLGKGVYSIQKISNIVSKKLGLSDNAVNFSLIFEIILVDNHSSKINPQPIEGTEASRSSMSLPNFQKINMLKINDKIESIIDWKNIPDQKLEEVIVTRS